jgi:hypothetical protein
MAGNPASQTSPTLLARLRHDPRPNPGALVKAREDPAEKFGNPRELAARLLDEAARGRLLAGNHLFPARRLVTSQVNQVGRDIGR